ncbi:MAG: hypothetical protein E4H36_16075 [Spirochaetales bacterium]|nr:MAG: hypothetical protein E4H36_16075 [Spirochaetales bacterium]
MIRVNGNSIPWEEDLTPARLFSLQGYRLVSPPVHVTVNGEKIGKERWASYKIPDEAQVALVSFLQGG